MSEPSVTETMYGKWFARGKGIGAIEDTPEKARDEWVRLRELIARLADRWAEWHRG